MLMVRFRSGLRLAKDLTKILSMDRIGFGLGLGQG